MLTIPSILNQTDMKNKTISSFILLVVFIRLKCDTIDVNNETLAIDKEIDKKFGDFFIGKRCCPTAKVFDVLKVGNGDWIRGSDSLFSKFYEQIVCPEGENIDIKECKDGVFEEYVLDSNLYNFSVHSTKLIIKNNCDSKAEEVKIDQLKDNFCVGLKEIRDEEDDEEDLEDYDDGPDLISKKDANSCLNSDAKISSPRPSTKFLTVIKYCPNPCGNSFQADDPMCIRTCLCPKNHVLQNGVCIPMTEEISSLVTKNVKKVWIGGMENWSPENRSQRGEVMEFGMGLNLKKNFELVNPLRRECLPGFKKRYLEPTKRCKDQFTIGSGHFNVRACRNKALKNATNAQVKLKIHNEHLNFRDSVNWLGGDCNFETSEGLFVDEFCLNILDDGNFTAEICEEIKGTEHYKYYPIFLITSSLLLAATFSFYTLRYKLLDHLTRIMRHFAGNMLVGFLVLSINIVFEVKESSKAGCYIIGTFQLFFFVSAFIFMSIMSYETFRRIETQITITNSHGSRGVISLIQRSSKLLIQTTGSSQSLLSDVIFREHDETTRNDRIYDIKRYRWEVWSAYVLSAMITFLAILIDSLPYKQVERCDSFRPRFGESQCFFSDRLNKAYWFYLPIGLSLGVNMIFFLMMVFIICSLDIKNGRKSNAIFKILLRYIILTGGIGVIWCFEIFAGIFADDPQDAKWIVFDVINMLQGVWIFVLFIYFNPEAKGIFCGKTSTKDETDMRMNVLEDKDLLQNEN